LRETSTSHVWKIDSVILLDALYEPLSHGKLVPSIEVVREFEYRTNFFWINWARKLQYLGRYRLNVERSLLILKLLTY